MLPLPDPVLSWDHGLLRPWRIDDAPTLVEAWTDPEIARWNAVPPEPSLAAAERWINGCEIRLRQRRSLDLCILDTTTYALVGEVGLSGFDWDRRAALIGYWLLPDGRGKGLAVDATRALSEWALAELGLVVLVAQCASANVASQAVAERAGYTHAQTTADQQDLWIRQAKPPAG